MPEDRSGSILQEIEKRNVEPIPRWHFYIRHFAFWTLATISVLTGSLAMATAIYVFLDNDFTEDQRVIHQYLTEQPVIADIIKSIPYIWIAALALFILVAYYGFRHTKRGYRYPTVKVIAGSLLVSLFISLGLNITDVGGIIHHYLIENVHAYNKLIYSNEHRWSQSEKGRLGGRIISYDKQNGLVILRNFRKCTWRVDIRKAEIQAGTIVEPGKYVKITGLKTGNRQFEAHEIQSWEKKYHKRPVSRQKTFPVDQQPEKPAP
ncbi:MAG: hypothetical protein FDX30_00525 [Chlorobium sp.]|nr:MAG: hypothetical protein FDX30_00525 [Chlorobium sp.]